MTTQSNDAWDELCRLTTESIKRFPENRAAGRPAVFKALCAQRPDLAAKAIDPTGRPVVQGGRANGQRYMVSNNELLDTPVVQGTVAQTASGTAAAPAAVAPVTEPATFEEALAAAESSTLVKLARKRAAAQTASGGLGKTQAAPAAPGAADRLTRATEGHSGTATAPATFEEALVAAESSTLVKLAKENAAAAAKKPAL